MTGYDKAPLPPPTRRTARLTRALLAFAAIGLIVAAVVRGVQLGG